MHSEALVELRNRLRGGSASAAAAIDWFEPRPMRRINWSAELSPAVLQSLQSSGSAKRHRVGEIIFAPATDPDSVYLLESGLVRVYRVSEAGSETSFGYVAPGEVFGELSAFGDYPRESFAQAVQASVVWALAREPFQRMMASCPPLVLSIARQMAQRMKRVEARIEDLVFRSVRIRVAHMLADLAESFGRPDGAGVMIDMPLTQTDLATLVGATRQTVNQALGELAKEGLVERRCQRIVVSDIDALAQLVSEAPEGARGAAK